MKKKIKYLMKVDTNGILKSCPTNDCFGTGQKQYIVVQIVLDQNQTVRTDTHNGIHFSTMTSNGGMDS